MARITRTIEIKAPPEKVFAFMLSEKMNDLVWGKWLDGKWTSLPPIGVGSTSHWLLIYREMICI